MTGPTVRFKVAFGNEPRCRVDLPGAIVPEGYASPTARYLAMAHRMEALIRDGTLRDYAHAAAWLGVSKSRAITISRLIFLAPDIQEAILLGGTAASEHRLREVARMASWGEQRYELRRAR